MTTIHRIALAAAGAAALLFAGCGAKTGPSGTASNTDGGKRVVVGYSQIGAESGWRMANTKSIQDEAAKRNIDLRFSDAQQKQENQIKALRSFIAQKVDVIVFSPVVESGWGPVMKEIKDAHIPVIVSDRRPDVDASYYVTFIGSDFIKEGHEAADFLTRKMDGKATIAELQGTTGSAPANDRAKGFRDGIAKYPGMKIVISQDGDFSRAKGKEVMEAFLKGPQGKTINALFSHNDDMALGAIQAMEAAGVKPGQDIKIVSVDGVNDAFEAMAAGKLNCSVECNPLLGPQIFDAVQDVLAHKPVPARIVTKESVYDETTAKAALPNRKY